MPNRYEVNQHNNGDGCCSGLRKRLRSVLRSCTGGSCSSSDDDEEVELEEYRQTGSPVPSISSQVDRTQFRVSSVGELNAKTRRDADELQKLLTRYKEFGCSPGDDRPACKHLRDRIKELKRSLLKRGVALSESCD
ncbi:uncharacterized protein cubi_03228 [Cryptosporidium ubiquitum]|uniref:Uncharacterized protein n=1 Tax=Cryptosporidium ubiquitum TaxID=857276 RepID=A0A1J4M9P3_9CRYT|nr:uncharacterized protein cubi_03228 [Cryptosporidium ubiquitum]OII70930.1 hypothetical protein cubi_03228 [Cryptosporidium ubiquitum]